MPPMGRWGGCTGGRLLGRKRLRSSDAPIAAPAADAAVLAVSENWVELFSTVELVEFAAVSAALFAVFTVMGAPQLGQNLTSSLICEPQYSHDAMSRTLPF